MKYVVRSEKTGSFMASYLCKTKEEAHEQMEMWADVDKKPDAGPYEPDWAEFVVEVPDEDADEALDGFTKSERFVEGICGDEYLGSYYWLCKIFFHGSELEE